MSRSCAGGCQAASDFTRCDEIGLCINVMPWPGIRDSDFDDLAGMCSKNRSGAHITVKSAELANKAS